jgi:hypothetical protein
MEQDCILQLDLYVLNRPRASCPDADQLSVNHRFPVFVHCRIRDRHAADWSAGDGGK